MTRVKRFDTGNMTKKAERTPQGYLRAPAFATRTGVLSYRMPDGSVRRELRHPDDVFDPKSLATLAGVPVTDDHPNFKDPRVMLLDAANTHEYMVGYTGDSVERIDDKFVGVVLTLTKLDAIEKVESGKNQVSCGYTCELEDAVGEYEGEPYNCRQRDIEYNHLAVVDRGRAGRQVSLHLDSADAVQVDPSQPLEEPRMEKITLNGVEYSCTPELKAAIEKAMSATADAAKPVVAAAEQKATEQTARADKAEARADGLQVELGKAKDELKTRNDSASPDKVRAAAKELVRVETVARRVLDKDTVAKLDSMDEKAIKIAVVKAESKDLNLDGKSDEYLNARFDMIDEALKADPAAELGSSVIKARADGAEDPVAAARKRQQERNANAWKGEAAAK
jgi:hypothetical protein